MTEKNKSINYKKLLFEYSHNKKLVNKLFNNRTIDGMIFTTTSPTDKSISKDNFKYTQKNNNYNK